MCTVTVTGQGTHNVLLRAISGQQSDDWSGTIVVGGDSGSSDGLVPILGAVAAILLVVILAMVTPYSLVVTIPVAAVIMWWLL